MTIRRAVRGLGYALAVLLAWFAIMLAIPFVGPAGRVVAVVAPIAVVEAAGGRIIEVRRGAVLAQSSDPEFVARLYRGGARVVLEGRIAIGCFPGLS